MPTQPCRHDRFKRNFFNLLRVASTCAAMLLAGSLNAQPTVLPIGSSPDPLALPHFPDRLHAVVWRNWQLVEPARIAEAIGTTEENIVELAASMGLPQADPVLPAWRRRGYITILRRNWHLLPYDQILTLVDMTADELAVALREDDFLFVKLGSLKPKCERVQWAPANAEARRRAVEIRELVQEHFESSLDQPREPAFQFIADLKKSVIPLTEPTNRSGLRFLYSYFGTFGDPLIDAELDPYPDGLLSRLAEQGVNGVWLHVVLRQISPPTPDFPEFGKDHHQRLDNLRSLVRRAKRFGISVYLYMNEPRAMPEAFFAERRDMAGVAEGDWRTLCTSDERVRKWLEDSLSHLFTNVPDLGGVFTISGSENLTHCASHGQHQQCPRCQNRTDAEIIAEVNATIARGVHRSSPSAKVLVWDWGWRAHGDATEIIQQLPKDVWLMSVSEWAKPIERGGVKSTVGEYSMSVVGPGPRAMRHWEVARQAGLKTVAKMQINCTWELSAVPYLPVMDLVAQHCANLAKLNVDGAMLSWSLGGYPSPNLSIAQQFSQHPDAKVDEVLDSLAEQLYGKQSAPSARHAWKQFSDAFEEYPYCGSLLYTGPQHVGPANLLWLSPTHYSATMVGFPYDDLNRWRGPYAAEVFIAQMQKVASGWDEGLVSLKQAVEHADRSRQAFAKKDAVVAEVAGIHFASVANQARFILARDRQSRDTEPDKGATEMCEILDDEIRLAKRLYELSRADSRIGFEASNHYYYQPHDLIEKVISCVHLKQQLQ